jgi:predicted Rossmann fold nucleotide-binding protein DprA/Smf involved in DNA uptake
MSRDIREVIRDEPLVSDRLLALLADGPLTVSELATAAGLPAEEVMVWLMGLRRYGRVVEQKAAARATEFRYQAVGEP